MDTAKALDLTLDEAQLFRLEADAAVVIVGNPAIADVTVQSGRLLIVTPKSVGQTNLIVLDKSGSEIATDFLKVRASGAPFVSVFQGAKRATFYCAPVCQAVASPVDDPKAFQDAADAAARKIDIGRKAADSRTELRE